MTTPIPPAPARDKLLFTPGPLTTSLSVKQAMLHDAGSWHFEFSQLIRTLREQILALAELPAGGGWETVLMQGSGTFGVESVIGSVIPPAGKLLVLINGAYGERIAQMAGALKIPHVALRFPEHEPPSIPAVSQALAADPSIRHVAAVHCETTTGILNPLAGIGREVKRHGCVFIVDAISSFGAIPIDLESAGIDFLVSSANKCLEGVPGFSFIIARRERLLETEGWARSLSLDLLGQWQGFQKNGQFRYTPPTHSLLAFAQALAELNQEGGIPARGERYRANHSLLLNGMRAMGFHPFLSPEWQSFIITAFHFPAQPAFRFPEFYRLLSEAGLIIYPGKLTQVDTFRIGTIGRLFPADIRQLLMAIRETLGELGCPAPVLSPAAL